ncbi:T9SS type A sorting domain-containing protein [candidate division KSB1 bacterium]|nr:T9SS type A sorting domain-containing protein [candidate division KSB1 bacterium]
MLNAARLSILRDLTRKRIRRLPILFILLNILIGTGQAHAQIRIMPLGNSITHGEKESNPIGGFRDDLAFMLSDEAVEFDLVGTFNDGNSLYPWHQGDPGKTASYLASQITNWLTQTYPDIVLLHIGTNDIYSGYTIERIVTDIERILEQIWIYDPDIPILLCSTIPRNDAKNDNNTRLARAIHDLAVEKIRAYYPLRYVGQNEVFVSNPNWAVDYLGDLWHPNNLGYSVMAEVYFNTIMTELTAGRRLVTDNFDRSSFGQYSWNSEGHYNLYDDKLSIDAGGNFWWKPAVYVAEMDPIAISFSWGDDVNAYNNGNAGIALMLNDDTPTADGYLVYKESETAKLKLFLIRDGQIDRLIDETVGLIGTPVKDDTFKVAFYTDDFGHHFNFLINEYFDGKLTDPDKVHAHNTDQFAGIMLAGTENNIIDNFTLIHSEFHAQHMVKIWGDEQQGEKNTILSDSLVVEVIDNHGSPIPNIAVNFTVTSGDATVIENPTSNHIVLEAEVGQLTYPMQIKNDAGASGGKYITVPQEYEDDSMAKAVYDFTTSHQGPYVVWGRVRSTGDTHDSFKISLDNQPEVVWHIPGNWNWTWDQVYVFNGDDPVQFNLSAGAHQLTVKNREWGSQIDKLIITNDLGFNPNSYMPKSVETVITNTSGKAYARVELGSTPGLVEVTASSPSLQEQAVFNLVIRSEQPIPYSLTIIGGNDQFAAVGETLPLPLEVRVADINGAPIPDVDVMFDLVQGTGTITEPQPVVSDALGIAKINFSLGQEEGVRSIQAFCPDHAQLGTVLFQASAVAMGYSINGKVTYFSNGDPVDDVALVCLGDVIRTDTTDNLGNYSIRSIESGSNIVITPIKNEFRNEDGQLAFMYNAALIMRHVVQLDTLKGYYLEAADVDLNGNVQTYDAALIAHYAVGLPRSADSHVGEWLFHPAYRQYFQVSTNYNFQDYLTLLLGDVSGSWNQNEQILKSDLRQGLAHFNELSVNEGSRFSLPLWIEKDMNMISCALKLKYDADQLRFIDIKKTELTEGFEIAWNDEHGVIKAGLYGANEISTKGVLIEIVFEAISSANREASIDIEQFQINNFDAECTTAVVQINSDIDKPDDFILYQNYPNPFNPETMFRYRIPEAGEMKITIYNLLGQEIISLYDGLQTAGLHEIKWNGVDAMGNQTAAGAFICELQFGNQHKTIKLMKLE